MDKRILRSARSFLFSGFLGVFALSGAGSAAETAALVTATVGQNKAGDSSLEHRSALAEGDKIETEKEGGCSLLVDKDAVMELCGGTSMRLERKDGKEGTRIVRLDQGEVRLVVEPRLGEQRIEVHTPAAIATILGTVVLIQVDALGVTRVMGDVNKTMVKSNLDRYKQETVVGAGQQLVIHPGEPPPAAPTGVSRKELDAFGGCLLDFHEVSVSMDRTSAEKEAIDEQVEETVEETDNNPPVAAGENAPPTTGGDATDPPTEDPDVITTVDANEDKLGQIVDPFDFFPGDPCDMGPGVNCGPR